LRIYYWLKNHHILGTLGSAFRENPSTLTDQQSEWVELAQQAVIDEHRLELAYFTTDVGQVNLRQVGPYFINLAPSVRLVEFCQWRQGYRDFLFARMESLEVLDQGFKRDPNFDPQEYLSGSQIKGQPIVALLIVDPPVSRWLDQDVPAGVEEKKQFLGGRVCLVVDTEGEKELVRWVLKHGRLVKVIEPERLVIRIKKEDMPRKPIKNGLRQRQ